MEERSLRVYADKTFFTRITNTLTKMFIPTKIGVNNMLISMKRNNILKNYEAFKNAEEEKKEAIENKYEESYSLYLEAIDKYVMDSIYKKVKSEAVKTYTTFRSDEPEATPQKPILVLEDNSGKLTHRINGVFTNPGTRSSFEAEHADGVQASDILKYLTTKLKTDLLLISSLKNRPPKKQKNILLMTTISGTAVFLSQKFPYCLKNLKNIFRIYIQNLTMIFSISF